MRSLFRSLAVGLLVAGALSAPTAQTRVVRFTIDDTHKSGGGAGVFGDSADPQSVLTSYADFRINQQDAANWCVDAEPFSPGNLFVRLNRKLDGEAGVLRCSENLNPNTGLLGVPRNFVLRIADDAACDILADPSAGLPVNTYEATPTDPPTAWVVDPTADNGTCVIARNDNPRIRLDTLYKSKARTTGVDFLLVMFGYPNSYEIRSVSTATISPNTSTHKGVAYTGTFQLVKFEPGKKTANVGQPFAMPVRMDFYQ